MAALITAFLAALMTALAKYAGPFIAKAMVFFGLSAVAYHLGVEPLLAAVKSSVGALPTVAIQVIGLTQCDKAITAIFSALAVRGASRIVMRRGVPGS